MIIVDMDTSTYAEFGRDGRVPKQALVITTSLLFAIVLTSFFLRLYIRLYLQRQFSLDDAFIAIGVVFLSVGMGLLYHFADDMFLAEAYLTNDRRVAFNGDNINKLISFDHLGPKALAINWCVINMVKLSFLALFKRLVYRLRPLVIYWWIVLVYTIVVWGYGISAYFSECTSGNSIVELVQCVTEDSPARRQQLYLAVAQLTLDIIGDILIVAIPVKLIWQVKVPFTQKLALFFSLSLSILLVALTLVRASGILYLGQWDVVWETFWQYTSSEVGLILSSTTAFRSFFVTRQHNARPSRDWTIEPGRTTHVSLWVQTQDALVSIRSSLASKRRRPSTSECQVTNPIPNSLSIGQSCNQVVAIEGLPRPPRALLTGMRSRKDVREQEEPTRPSTQVMVSTKIAVNHENLNDIRGSNDEA